MSHIRYRRNIDCLTSNQLHDLREALAALYSLPPQDPHSFATLAGLHGSPPPSYCRHGTPGFLTWHRAYMLAFERALQCINPSIMLPFWDWSSGPSTGVPDACAEPSYVNRDGDSVPNPLYSGPLPASAGGGQTSRRPNIDTTAFGDLATSAQGALASATFNSFQISLDSVHGGVHVRVGGQMASVAYAAYDPIFYLHHANVDRLWAIWQNSHPGPLPPGEASLELEPFNRPYSTSWHVGAEYASTEALGYRYTNFCFFIPPIIVLAPIPIKVKPDWLRERMRTARLLLRSERMQARSMELRVFVNQPRVSARTKTIDNPHFAGSFGLFGMGEEGEEQGLMVQDRDERFDLELDITHAMRAAGEDGEEEVTLFLLSVDADGKSLPAEQVDVTGLEILLE